MKAIAAIFLTVSLITGSVGTKDSFRKFYRHHKHEAGVMNFSVPAFVFKLASQGQDEEVKMIAKSTHKVRFLIKEENGEGLYKQIDKYLTTDVYKPLLHIKDGDSFVKIVAKASSNEIKEIIIAVNDKESFVAIQLKGDYTLDMIADMTKLVN